MSNYIAELKTRVLEAEAKVAYLESLRESFLTGDVPQGASIEHFIFAKYGRIRQEEMKKTAALLRPNE